MPHDAEEFAVFIGTLGTIGIGIIGTISVIVVAIITTWRKNIRPLLEETRNTAKASAAAARYAEQELKTNHGSSTRDAVNRIEAAVHSVDKRLTAFGDELHQQRREIHQVREHLERSETEIFNRLRTVESANPKDKGE